MNISIFKYAISAKETTYYTKHYCALGELFIDEHDLGEGLGGGLFS